MVIESELKLWMVKYKNRKSRCNWMLRAVKRYDYFEIICYVGAYTCISAMLSQDHSGLNSNFIINKIWDLVKEVPIIFIAEIGAVVKNRFNYMPGCRKLWEVKQKVMALAYGDWDKSYDLLSKWLHAVQEFNIDSWVKFIITPISHPACTAFDCAFWVFAPLIEGFRYCIPIINIDATFLYGKYREKLMIAIAVDGNNQIFSLAFVIIDEESTNTWSWFLACLRYLVTSR